MSATATTSLEILPAAPGSSALLRDFHARAPALAGFYAGHPSDPDAWRRKADAVRARLDAAARQRLAPALRPLSDAAQAKLKRILAGDGFLITTGQQAGLFGGPLYTVHKALSAIALADAAETLLGTPVLACFWVAADDHDWAEVNHAWILDREGRLVRVSDAQDPDAAPLAMADRRLGEGVAVALELLRRAMPETEFSEPLLDAVAAAYSADATVAGAFEELLATLFRGHDLALVSSAHPALRAAAAPVLARELALSAEHASVLADTTARLEAAGYPAQVQIDTDASNVFLHDEGGRDRLVREDGAWVTRRSGRRLSDDDVQRMLVGDATVGFSPNVLLRPVVESAVLPTLCYVGGPAEVTYFAQIGCLFEAHGVEPPIVQPRSGFTLVEGRVRRVLEKFGLELADLARPLHELEAGLVRRDVPEPVTDAAEALRAVVTKQFARLTEGAVEVDPTLEAWLEKRRNAALIEIADSERKVATHLRKRMSIELGQLARAADGIAPRGAPQERVLNVLPFLARYGPELLHDLRATLRPGFRDVAPDWSGVRCGPAEGGAARSATVA